MTSEIFQFPKFILQDDDNNSNNDSNNNKNNFYDITGNINSIFTNKKGRIKKIGVSGVIPDYESYLDLEK